MDKIFTSGESTSKILGKEKVESILGKYFEYKSEYLSAISRNELTLELGKEKRSVEFLVSKKFIWIDTSYKNGFIDFYTKNKIYRVTPGENLLPHICITDGDRRVMINYKISYTYFDSKRYRGLFYTKKELPGEMYSFTIVIHFPETAYRRYLRVSAPVKKRDDHVWQGDRFDENQFVIREIKSISQKGKS